MLPWCLPGSSLLTGPEGLLAKERENLKRLKYLRRYRQRYGVEALLHRQLKERRMLVTEGAAQQVLESGCASVPTRHSGARNCGFCDFPLKVRQGYKLALKCWKIFRYDTICFEQGTELLYRLSLLHYYEYMWKEMLR